jgi:hypothetical protein
MAGFLGGGTCGSVVGWGTMLQTEITGSIPHEDIRFFFNLHNPSSRIMALG